MTRRTFTLLVFASAVAGCGGIAPGHSSPTTHGHALRPARAATARPGRRRHRLVAQRSRSTQLVALVTAQSEDRVLMVELPSGRVVRTVSVPGRPDYIAAAGPGGPYVVVSEAGWVTLLGGPRLRREATLTGFATPHIPGITPGGGWAYVTDDARGQLATIGLTDGRVDSRLFVGSGAHHFAFSPDGQHVWVALGQAASTIVILSTVSAHAPSAVEDPAHPHVVARLHPGFLAHDLKFTPDGRQVWVTSASGPDVSVFSARRGRLLYRVAAGLPPQHIIFAGASAYITSGYGSQIERVSTASGQVLERVRAPYGSFELDAAGPYVVTTSLFRGTVAIYDRALRLLRLRRVAPSAEDVAVVDPSELASVHGVDQAAGRGGCGAARRRRCLGHAGRQYGSRAVPAGR